MTMKLITNANRFYSSRPTTLRLTGRNIEARLKALALYIDESKARGKDQVVQDFFEQRKIRFARVKEFMEAYKAGWSAVTSILLGLTRDGALTVVMDGQHRLVALLLLHYEGYDIDFTFNALNLYYKTTALRDADYHLATNVTLPHNFGDTMHPVLKKAVKAIDKIGQAVVTRQPGKVGRPKMFRMKANTLAQGVEVLQSGFTRRPSDNPLRKSDPLQARKLIDSALNPLLPTIAAWQARAEFCSFASEITDALDFDKNHAAAAVFLGFAEKHGNGVSAADKKAIEELAFSVATGFDPSSTTTGIPIHTTTPAAVLKEFFKRVEGQQTGSGLKGTMYIPLTARVAKECLDRHLRGGKFADPKKDLTRLIANARVSLAAEMKKGRFNPTTF